MYDITIEKIEEYNFKNKSSETYQYMLWMCNEIKGMSDPLKAARWMGYVLRIVEDLGFWDNGVSRNYTREDVRSGNDTPRN